MKVTKYVKVSEDGPILAYVNFHIKNWGMYLSDCRVIKTRHGGVFIGFPGREYEKNGEKKYSSYLIWEKEMGERFQKAAKSAIEEFKNGNDNGI